MFGVKKMRLRRWTWNTASPELGSFEADKTLLVEVSSGLSWQFVVAYDKHIELDVTQEIILNAASGALLLR